MKNILTIIFAVLLSVGIISCDSNTARSSSGGSGSSLTDPTNDVAANVGPVAEIITEDSLNEINEIRGNIENYIDAIDGGNLDNPGVPFVVKYQFNDIDTNSISGTVDVSQSAVSCSDSGTYEVIGSLDVTYNQDEATGTLSGTLVLQYSNCQETVLMQTSNGNCTVTPNIDGEVTLTIATSFDRDISITQTLSYSDDTLGSASTSAPLSIAVGSTSSSQTYSFSQRLATLTGTNVNFSGSVVYGATAYDVSELRDFIEASTTSIVCP